MTSEKKSTNKKEKTKKKLLLVHGLAGSPESDWLPWLKGEMESKDWDVVAPALPNADKPMVSEWVPALYQAAGKVDSNTYIVGYSLGCIAALRYLDNLADDVHIGGAILVAGFDNPLNSKEMESFFYSPINWEKAKRACKKFVVIHSEDDPYVPADNGIRIKNNLNAKRILVNGYRHFAGSHGIHTLPIVLQELLEISDLSK